MKIDPKKIKDFLVSFLLGCLIVLIVFCSIFVFQGIRIAQKADSILEDSKDSGAAVQSTLNDLNATVILGRTTMVNIGLLVGRIEQLSQKWETTANKEAEYWKALQNKSLIAIDNLNEATASLNKIISRSDKRLNDDDGLLPAATGAVKQVEKSTASITENVNTIATKAGQNLDNVNEILSSKEWKETLIAIKGSAQNAEATTAEIREAARQLPSIAQSLEKFAKTGSKYQKYLIIFQILSLIGQGIPH